MFTEKKTDCSFISLEGIILEGYTLSIIDAWLMLNFKYHLKCERGMMIIFQFIHVN